MERQKDSNEILGFLLKQRDFLLLFLKNVFEVKVVRDF